VEPKSNSRTTARQAQLEMPSSVNSAKSEFRRHTIAKVSLSRMMVLLRKAAGICCGTRCILSLGLLTAVYLPCDAMGGGAFDEF
jgi:hypothetical protein